MKFDLTSDLHIDFWVEPKKEGRKQTSLMESILEKLIPEDKSNTLVIAGDLGHYNKQNLLFFKLLKTHYENVIWVHGNHDLYMISNNIEKQFKKDSMNRLANMTSLLNDIGVIRLDGNVIDIGGVKIGGAGGWYDNAYAKQVHNLDDQYIMDIWLTIMNDSQYIKADNKILNYLTLSKIENEKIKNIVNDIDVMVTHIPPEWSRLPFKYQKAESTFWLFDGSEYIKKLDNKIWCFGHTHDQYYHQLENGLMMIANPLGYPGESYGKDISKRSFKTIEVIK